MNRFFLIFLFAVSMMNVSVPASAQEENKQLMEMSVVVVNPSKIKAQSVPIKMDLPQEVTPKDIVDSAGLDVEFDTDRSIYYLYKEAVSLKPGETRTYNVEIRDVWLVPQEEIDSLRKQTEFVVKRFEGNEFYDAAKSLGDTILQSLDTVVRTQSDAAVSRRRHIGIHRDNVKIVSQVKENIAMLENKLMLPKARPIPEVLEKTDVKTEAPSKTTTWMIIFIIMLFIGMLAGVFFFTWQTQAHFTKNLISNARNLVFPKKGGASQDQSQDESKP